MILYWTKVVYFELTITKVEEKIKNYINVSTNVFFYNMQLNNVSLKKIVRNKIAVIFKYMYVKDRFRIYITYRG